MRFGIKPTGEAAFEPVTIDEMKLHLRVDSTEDDQIILSAQSAARELCEAYTGRCLSRRAYLLAMDQFPVPPGCGYAADTFRVALTQPDAGWLPWSVDSDAIRLPYSPLVSVESITYVDPDGDTQTLDASDYVVDDISSTPRITPVGNWPGTRAQINAVRVAFTVGYANSTAVPAVAKQAIKLLVANSYENREAINVGNIVNEMPFGVQALLDSISVRRF